MTILLSAEVYNALINQPEIERLVDSEDDVERDAFYKIAEEYGTRIPDGAYKNDHFFVSDKDPKFYARVQYGVWREIEEGEPTWFFHMVYCDGVWAHADNYFRSIGLPTTVLDAYVQNSVERIAERVMTHAPTYGSKWL